MRFHKCFRHRMYWQNLSIMRNTFLANENYNIDLNGRKKTQCGCIATGIPSRCIQSFIVGPFLPSNRIFIYSSNPLLLLFQGQKYLLSFFLLDFVQYSV